MSGCRSCLSPRGLKLGFLLIVTLTFIGTSTYICMFTPLPVYMLDRLNLRPFFLPDILCKNCTHIPPVPVLISNKSATCPGDLLLLNVIISYHANVASRNVIRSTWGGVKSYKGHQISTLFAFGVHADANLNGQLQYEQNLHHDILQLNMEDHYRSLTMKTLLVFRWIHENCPAVRFVLKTDDDSFNNVPRIADYLLHVKQTLFVGGYCFTVMPDRHESSKYYVPVKMYPDTYYPTYCAGPGYIVSYKAIGKLLSIYPHVTFIPMEDVFIAGLCREAAGIQYTNMPGMIVGENQLQKCDMATWAKNTHNVIPERMQVLWDRVVEADIAKDCVPMYIKDFVFILVGLVIWGKILHYVLTS